MVGRAREEPRSSPAQGRVIADWLAAGAAGAPASSSEGSSSSAAMVSARESAIAAPARSSTPAAPAAIHGLATANAMTPATVTSSAVETTGAPSPPVPRTRR